jgi:hypothetical protein
MLTRHDSTLSKNVKVTSRGPAEVIGNRRCAMRRSRRQITQGAGRRKSRFQDAPASNVALRYEHRPRRAGKLRRHSQIGRHFQASRAGGRPIFDRFYLCAVLDGDAYTLQMIAADLPPARRGTMQATRPHRSERAKIKPNICNVLWLDLTPRPQLLRHCNSAGKMSFLANSP